MFSEVLCQLKVKHNKASAYHAQSQGALERFHQNPEVAAGLVLYRAKTGLGGRSAHVGCQGGCVGEHWV